jgi:hypothetical protein
MTPEEDRPVSTGLAGPPGRVKPITRALILEQLRDFDGEDDPYKQVSWADDAPGAGYKDDSALVDLEPSLQEARNNLKVQCEEQQSMADWELEYPHQPASHRPSFIPGFVVGMATLKRIAQGQGPRPKEYDDLIAPFRRPVEDEDSKSNASSYIEETYEEVLQILLEWNKSVSLVQDLERERQELLDALDERNRFVDDAQKRKDVELLNQPTPRIQKALHTFRPETVSFQNQQIYDLLIMLVANLRVAKPDIDDELKFAIFQTIIKEATMRLLFEKSFREEKRRVVGICKPALHAGDNDEVLRLMEPVRKLERENKFQRIKEIVDNTKFARQDLYQKVLVALQDLAVLQAAQLEAASDLRLPQVIFAKINESTHHTDEELLEVEDRCEGDVKSIDMMLSLTGDCLRRTKKFAALDIADPEERMIVKQERMENPRTAEMMMTVVEDTQIVREVSGLVRDHMTKMEASLETILAAANKQFRIYEGGLQVVGEIDEADDEVGVDGARENVGDEKLGEKT